MNNYRKSGYPTDDTEAIATTLQYCSLPGMFLVKKNLNPAVALPEKHTTEVCFAVRLANGCSLREFVSTLGWLCWLSSPHKGNVFNTPGGNYVIFVDMNKTLPDEDGEVRTDRGEIEFSQAGDYAVGRIHYYMRMMKDKDGVDSWTEPAPLDVKDVWFNVLNRVMEPFMSDEVTCVREFSDFIYTDSMEKLSGWLKLNGVDLPQDIFELPEPAHRTIFKEIYTFETENTDKDYIDDFKKQFAGYKQLASDDSVFFFNPETLETVEISDGELRLTSSPGVLHEVSRFLEKRGWKLLNMKCSQEGRLGLEGYQPFLEGLAVNKIGIRFRSPAGDYHAAQESQDNAFFMEFFPYKPDCDKEAPTFQYRFTLGKNSPARVLENLRKALGRWEKKHCAAVEPGQDKDRQQYLTDYVAGMRRALQYAGTPPQ